METKTPRSVVPLPGGRENGSGKRRSKEGSIQLPVEIFEKKIEAKAKPNVEVKVIEGIEGGRAAYS